MYQHRVQGNREMNASVFYIQYIELKSDYMMHMYEVHYIAKLKPWFNSQFATEVTKYLDIPDLNWTTYISDNFCKNVQRNYIVMFGKCLAFDEIRERVRAGTEWYFKGTYRQYIKSNTTNAEMNENNPLNYITQIQPSSKYKYKKEVIGY